MTKIIISKHRSFLLVFVVLLMTIMQNTRFGVLQVVFEMIVLLVLFFILIHLRIGQWLAYLFSLSVLILVVSAVHLPLSIYMLTLKNFIMGLMSVIIFSKVQLNSSVIRLLLFVLVVTAVFTLLYNPSEILAFFAGKDDLLGKPSGIFLNYHMHAFFMGLVFLGLTTTLYRFILFSGFLIQGNVLTPAVAYILSVLKCAMKTSRITRLISDITFYLPVLIFISLFLNLFGSREFLAEFVLNLHASLYVLYMQIFNYQSYIDAFRFFPGDIALYYSEIQYFYPAFHGGMEIGNEIGFKAILVQGGVFITLFLYYAIYKYYKPFFIYILLASLHYPYLYTPLTYMIMGYFTPIVGASIPSRFHLRATHANS